MQIHRLCYCLPVAVDCFKAGPNFLVIDPDECIDCAVCVPECPAGAIYFEDDLPAEQHMYIDINQELAKKWKSITEREEPMADADQWNGVPDKLQYLDRGD